MFSRPSLSVIILIFIYNLLIIQNAPVFAQQSLELKIRLREVYTGFNSTEVVSLNGLGVGPNPDEPVYKIWARDNPDLDGSPWIGGNCLTDSFYAPDTSADFNYLIFNHTYIGNNIPNSFDLLLDAWESDTPEPDITTICSPSSQCTYEVNVCCGQFIFGSCVGVTVSDQHHCNANPFMTNIDYKIGPPCQWNDHGFLQGSCGTDYQPRIESYYAYHNGTSCNDPIELSFAPGDTVTHYNSTECYSDTWPNSPGNDVFYSFTLTSRADVTISLCDSTSFDSHLYLLDDSCTQISFDDDNCGSASSLAQTLWPGTYYVVVDGESLSDMGPFLLMITGDSIPCPTISVQTTKASACGVCNGSATVIVNGGLPPFTFQWAEGQTDSAISFLCAGSYTCTVTASNNCTDIVTAFVNTDSSSFSLSSNTSEVNCYDTLASMTAYVSGGTPPYLYDWNDGSIDLSSDTSVVHYYSSPGKHFIGVTDTVGCFESVSDSIADRTLLVSISQVTKPVCTSNNGAISIDVIGGHPPLSYSWSNGASTDSLTGLNAGTYTVTVTDAIGCEEYLTFELTSSFSGLSVTSTSTAFNCNTGSLGSAQAFVSGGQPPYTYEWNTIPAQHTQVVTGLAPGSYGYTVTDANGCFIADSITIGFSSQSFFVYLNTVQPNCTSPGSITADVIGGFPPFTYEWSTSLQDTTSTITVLTPGIYSVTVTDAQNCQRSGSCTITSNCKNIIQGVAFNDANGNCVWDSAETPFTNGTVVASNGTHDFYGSLNIYGEYIIRIGLPGIYSLSVSIPFGACGSFSACSTSLGSITFPSLGDSSLNNNLGIANGETFDLAMHPGWSSANPGFTKRYWVLYYNQSSIPFTGNATITFKYDSNLIYQNSAPIPAIHDPLAHTLTWNVSNVPSHGWVWNDRLRSEFLVPVGTPLGYLLQSEFTIEPIVDDCDPADNQLHFSEAVTGSLDPNEKEVSPPGGIIESDSMLKYTIHFQNTGTDTTHFIIVKDTLLPTVDPGTVKTVASSHPYSDFSIEGEGILTWVFNPIFLPDSTVDEPASKGFVTFVVKKRKNMPIGTEIKNRASIYFDYNQPIVTNTVKNTIVDPVFVFNHSKEFVTVEAIPNPFSASTTIFVKGLKADFDLSLFDATGRLKQQLTSIKTDHVTLKRNDLSAGVYFYRITANGSYITTGKVVIK